MSKQHTFFWEKCVESKEINRISMEINDSLELVKKSLFCYTETIGFANGVGVDGGGYYFPQRLLGPLKKAMNYNGILMVRCPPLSYSPPFCFSILKWWRRWQAEGWGLKGWKLGARFDTEVGRQVAPEFIYIVYMYI